MTPTAPAPAKVKLKKTKVVRSRKRKVEPYVVEKQSQIRALAESYGLLAGPKTHVVRGRMPAELVEMAKKKTGIESDSRLVEVALMTIAVEDNYGAWLVSQHGTIPKELDLEF